MKNRAREAIAREASFGFKKDGPQWVKSALGFETGFSGRFELEYREGDHLLKIPVEPLINGDLIQISRAEAWEPPYETEKLSTDGRERIRRNIAAALRYLRVGHSFG